MIVESRRRWRRRGRARVLPRRPVPPSLVGLCFNCLGGGHVAAVCRLPSRCLHCRCAGHRARDCKRGRSPVRGASRTKGAPRRRPLREQPRRLSSTVSGSNPDGENSGGAPDPHMGPGWGLMFQEVSHVVIGKIPCPLRPDAGLRFARPHLLTWPQRQDDGRAPPRVAPVDVLLSGQEPDMAPLSCLPVVSCGARG
jgi:hypothetical protein